MLLNEVNSESFNAVSSPYNLFKYAVRTEITRRYYERRIKTFFDFIGFMVGSVIEERCNSFSEKGKEANDWALTGIIKFLQYEKERVQRGEITAAIFITFFKANPITKPPIPPEPAVNKAEEIVSRLILYRAFDYQC